MSIILAAAAAVFADVALEAPWKAFRAVRSAAILPKAVATVPRRVSAAAVAIVQCSEKCTGLAEEVTPRPDVLAPLRVRPPQHAAQLPAVDAHLDDVLDHGEGRHEREARREEHDVPVLLDHLRHINKQA